MKYAYDLHIHTALSPCADEDMTPNNIVNMSILKELDIIAITDHNSCENAEAVMKVAKGTDLLVIPGMEIETSEEIHMVCLFPNIDFANKMQNIVYDNLPKLKNDKNIFGKQLILDDKDDIVGENEKLLLTATKLSIYDVVKYTKELKGVSFPAHIDRKSYSIISNLGWIPKDLDIHTIEVSKYCNIDKIISKYNDFMIIKSSDAHYLTDILEREQFIEIKSKSIEEIIKYLS
ncbi:PHP domain-containing protein [Defluviitalea phaphyphila]|uniref:PHP domain-containing protein n=1 Tax=Defluviitalea phaphyphila TaxID=1473580 RepID=UPI000731B000|nr:PHP domain-containing protein [Defluviitalea phaphyphila]